MIGNIYNTISSVMTRVATAAYSVITLANVALVGRVASRLSLMNSATASANLAQVNPIPPAQTISIDDFLEWMDEGVYGDQSSGILDIRTGLLRANYCQLVTEHEINADYRQTNQISLPGKLSHSSIDHVLNQLQLTFSSLTPVTGSQKVLEACDSNGMTLIDIAVQQNHQESFRTLVSLYGDMNQVGFRLIFNAAFDGHTETVQALAALDTNVNLTNNN